MNTHQNKPHGQLSGLSPLADSVPPTATPRLSHEARLRALMGRLRTAEDRKTMLRVGVVAIAVLGLGAGTWAAIEFWPRRQPDFLADPMDDVLDYTLLTQDFNKLPLEKRLGLIKDLVSRLKTMSAQDSMMMAMFATRLKEEARRQLEENAKRLAVDMLDNYAKDYKDVPPEDRAAFLDSKIIEFTKMMEDIAGERSGLSEDDNERLAQLKRQAKKDEEQMQKGDRKMRPERVTNFVKFLQEDSEKIASPVQQARMVKYTRDLVRHLRGESVGTPPPAPPTPPDAAPGAQPEPEPGSAPDAGSEPDGGGG